MTDYLTKYTTNEPRVRVQALLFELLKRLQARSEAVERFEYHRLETIDDNCKHLLTTLEQYGIKATTYHQALREFERKYAPAPPATPPDDIREKTHQRIKSRIGNLVRLQEARDTDISENPAYEDFIRVEYQKAIDRVKREAL